MGFVKVVKNKSYFRRFQVKYRRRRECKTDYQARQKLILQDKNKYKSPKYRLVVRVTNRDIITQIVAADLTHDVVLTAAYSHELPRYGLKVGLKNYGAAYATGLLLARRVNSKFNLPYDGQTTVDGELYQVEANDDGSAPFKALLDIGLKRSTTGARIWGVLKGASDGGMEIPHNDHRFPGSKKENGEWKMDPKVHRKYIFGQHVAEYMNTLQSENEELYNKQFKKYIDNGIKPDVAGFEKLYKSVHAAIRKNPTLARSNLELGYFGTRTKAKTGTEKYEKPKKPYNRGKTSLAQRKARITQKLTHKGVKSIKH